MNEININSPEEIRKRLGLDSKSLEELVDDAYKEIVALCKGKHWLMSIPVQGYDSDIVISEALEAQAREIQKLGRVAKNARSLLLNIYEFDGLEFGAGELMQYLHDALDEIPELRVSDNETGR